MDLLMLRGSPGFFLPSLPINPQTVSFPALHRTPPHYTAPHRTTPHHPALQCVQMLCAGSVGPEEVVHCWLADLRCQEYFALFAAAGYDLPTISRM